MPFELDIVCLANSWKHRGRCIAGKVYGGEHHGRWVRPVSPTVGQRQITPLQMQYARGGSADVFDVMRIQFDAQELGTFQSENYLISDARWQKVGEIAPTDIAQWLDTPNQLWENGSRSTYGQNDKIDNWRLAEPRSSLTLIRPDYANVRVSEEHNGETKVRVLFRYNQTDYAFTTTDVRIQAAYRERPHGLYPLPNVQALTVSLGERLPPEGGHSYKLIAHVFEG